MPCKLHHTYQVHSVSTLELFLFNRKKKKKNGKKHPVSGDKHTFLFQKVKRCMRLSTMCFQNNWQVHLNAHFYCNIRSILTCQRHYIQSHNVSSDFMSNKKGLEKNRTRWWSCLNFSNRGKPHKEFLVNITSF